MNTRIHKSENDQIFFLIKRLHSFNFKQCRNGIITQKENKTMEIRIDNEIRKARKVSYSFTFYKF